MTRNVMRLVSVPWRVVGVVLSVLVIFCTGDETGSSSSSSSSSSSAPPPPPTTYMEFYHEGRTAYTKERWFETIDFLERAIEDWHWYRNEIAQCRIKCKKFSADFSVSEKLKHLDLVLAGRWILNAACQKKCKREKFTAARRNAMKYDELIDEDFIQLKPYNYLQLAYYKASQFVTNYQELVGVKTHQTDYLEKAIQCAYTFLLRHPDDATMRRNLDFFKTIPATKDYMFVSREQPQHQVYYKAASAAYDSQQPDFKAVRDNILTALDEYYKAYAVCEAHCEKPLSNATVEAGSSRFSDGFSEDLYINIADHMAAYVQCVSTCPDTMARFLGKSLDNYLPNHYHYLQFAAYKVDDPAHAAMGCATYLMFHPQDEDMLNNRKFFETRWGIDGDKFVADPEAVQYLEHLKEINTLKSFIDIHYKRRREASKAVQTTITIDPSAHNTARPAITPDQLVPISEDKFKELKKEFGIELHMDDKALNGSHRVSLDKVATPEECDRLVALATAGSGGDGYNRFKGSGDHPHTPHESFAGLTVGRAAQLAEEGVINWQDAWTFLDLAERSRALTEKYFQLPSKLYFSFTHLVCRTAETSEAQKDRQDLSHPIHSDNCNLLEDGSCIYSYPAFTWRDFSSVLYLNSDYTGGDFLFAHPDKTVQASLPTIPGRLVAFHNGLDNLHGVKAVTSGRRCALAMWYTMDAAEHEKGQENHEAARTVLTNMKIKAEEEVPESPDSSTSTPSSQPPPSESTTTPDPTPKDVDDILASQDVEIEDLNVGGYVMDGPETHTEL